MPIYAIFVLAFVKSALSCDGVKVNLNQNDIEEGHNRYRADVSKTKIGFFAKYSTLSI